MKGQKITKCKMALNKQFLRLFALQYEPLLGQLHGEDKGEEGRSNHDKVCVLDKNGSVANSH